MIRSSLERIVVFNSGRTSLTILKMPIPVPRPAESDRIWGNELEQLLFFNPLYVILMLSEGRKSLRKAESPLSIHGAIYFDPVVLGFLSGFPSLIPSWGKLLSIPHFSNF